MYSCQIHLDTYEPSCAQCAASQLFRMSHKRPHAPDTISRPASRSRTDGSAPDAIPPAAATLLPSTYPSISLNGVGGRAAAGGTAASGTAAPQGSHTPPLPGPGQPYCPSTHAFPPTAKAATFVDPVNYDECPICSHYVPDIELHRDTECNICRCHYAWHESIKIRKAHEMRVDQRRPKKQASQLPTSIGLNGVSGGAAAGGTAASGTTAPQRARTPTPPGARTPTPPPPRATHQQASKPAALPGPSPSEQAVVVVSQHSWVCRHCERQHGTEKQAESCASLHNCANDGHHYFTAASSSQCQLCGNVWQCPNYHCDKIHSNKDAADACFSTHHGANTWRKTRSGNSF